MMKRKRIFPFPLSAYPRLRYGLLLLLLILMGFVAWQSWPWAAGTPATPTVSTQASAYVAEQRCLDCHPAQAELWQNSHHDLAMQEATPATVLGDFNDATFTAFGVTTRFYQQDDNFFINTQGADGVNAEFAVKYTFGVDPLQQYLVAMPNGRFQAFTVAWDVVEERWFHLYPDEEIAPDDPLHWTRRHFTWNSSCAECHSTDLQLNYDVAADQYATEWAAINVGCQACHGPGEEHVQWAEKGNQLAEPAKGLIVEYPTMSAEQLTESCAPCHARRHPISADDRPGEPFLDHFMPELLTEGRYYADGQILDEVFVYGSFVQSKMAQQGVRCTDCHEPHSLTLRAEGNALCVQCHQPNPPTARFAGLPAKSYDTADHHFHEPGTAGAQCVNCHMPARTYMVVDPRRDHSFRIPRPDLSVTLGVPNACTQCHTDQPAAWAVTAMTEWYGTAWQRPHFGEVLAAGRTGASDAAAQLSSLSSDVTQPPIVRATALDLLRAYGDLGVPARVKALQDEAPLLRALAAKDASDLPPAAQAPLFALLTDPRRAVRIEAARTLAAAPTAQQTAAQQTALARALDEYQAAQAALADHPEGHLNLGELFVRRGEIGQAEAAFQTALQRDDRFPPAYLNLATFYYRQGKIAQAEQTLRQGLAQLPGDGDLHYTLGLLLAEDQRTAEAVAELAQAAHALPTELRVQYNYGVLLQQTGQLDAAELVLQDALALNPTDPEVLYALVSLYAQRRQREVAHAYALRLTELYPTVPAFQQLLASLRP